MIHIYKITNKITNKIYIGQTSRTLEQRFQEHCRASRNDKYLHRSLYAAINKYGIDNFSIEEIEYCEDLMANEREKYWIKYYNSNNIGYNNSSGGENNSVKQIITIDNNYKLNPPFTQINNLAMQYAMKDLTYNAFKVYCILARNQPGFKFEYSPTWFQN